MPGGIVCERVCGGFLGGHPVITALDGNTRGLKAAQRKALERTFRRRVSDQEVVSSELARHLTSLSRELTRQIGVLISRRGTVERVIVGDASRLMIPEIGRLRGGVGRFRGLRLVHTHLRGEGLSADDLNDLALLRLDLVAVVQADEEGVPAEVEVAYLDPVAVSGDADEQDELFVRLEARRLQELDLDVGATIRALESELVRRTRGGAGKTENERVLMVGVSADDEIFEEAQELVHSTDVTVAGVIRQRRRKLDPRTIVGRGKINEIVLEGMRRGAEVAVFDVDLKPAQARAFEDASGLKAIDRTQLILDVFAQRARSRDGKLQVELAQLKYALPRLTEKDEGLSRLTGGIGGRGPGETVLEIGRRRINERIRRLEKEIGRLSRQRDVRRRRRREAAIPILSIVGYTNAGKSTLLNSLTQSEVETADKLFMTLDPTSRRLRFPREGEVIITDTVGFLSDLPEDLVSAFRATLEELADADLLLHVVDAADPRIQGRIEAVERLLDRLDLGELPRVLILNKSDLVSDEQMEHFIRRYEGVPVSATKKRGMEDLIVAAERMLGRPAAVASARG